MSAPTTSRISPKLSTTRTKTDLEGRTFDWAIDRADALRDTIQTKPFLSTGVVFAGGLTLGLCLGLALVGG